MWNLGEYRKHPQRLADHLPWATFIAPGVMLNKDGSLQKTITFRGPDLDSSTPYAIDVSAMPEKSRLKVLWAKGISYYHQQQYNKAIDPLRAVSIHTEEPQSETATVELIISLAKCGKDMEFQQACRFWTDKFHPTTERYNNILSQAKM